MLPLCFILFENVFLNIIYLQIKYILCPFLQSELYLLAVTKIYSGHDGPRQATKPLGIARKSGRPLFRRVVFRKVPEFADGRCHSDGVPHTSSNLQWKLLPVLRFPPVQLHEQAC